MFDDYTLQGRVGVLLALDAVSPKAAAWLNERPTDERGDITAQNAIWIAIAAAGAFAVAIILYNKFKAKANAVDMDNPGVLPAVAPY